MDYSHMTARRFWRWHGYRLRHRAITEHLLRVGKAVVMTYTRATIYDRRHVAMFEATRDGLFVRRGKSRDCLNFTTIRLV
jgi:hypothetical protein